MDTHPKTQLEALLEDRLAESSTEICLPKFDGYNVDN